MGVLADVRKTAILRAPPLHPLLAACDEEPEQIVLDGVDDFSTWATRGSSGLKSVPASSRALREVEALSRSLKTSEASGDRLLLIFDFSTPPGTGPRHSVLGCLWALLAQVMVKMRRDWRLDDETGGLAQHVGAMGKHHEWKRTDVFRLFIRSLLDALAFSEDHSAILVLVNLDDNVDGGGWLIEELRSGVDKTELKLAIVVIGQDAHSLENLGCNSTHGVEVVCNSTEAMLEVRENSAAEDSPRALNGSLESQERRGSTPGAEGTSTADATIWDLVSKNPLFYNFVDRLRLQLRPLDPWLRKAVCRWLQRSASHPGADVGDVIERILSKPSKDHVLSTILSSFDSSQSAMAAATVDLLRHGRRTPTVAEFKVLVRTAAARRGGGETACLTLEATESVFCGLVTSHRGKVAFAHPPVAAFLLSPRGQELDIVNSPPVAHANLAMACIDFLSIPDTQRLLHELTSQEPSSREALAGVEKGSAPVDYAVRYWPEHARRAGREWDPDSAGFRCFLENGGEKMGAWAMAYSVSANDGYVDSSEERERDGCAAIPILARYGLENAVEQTIKAFHGGGSLARQQSRAFVSAAAAGSLGTLRLLARQAQLLPCDEDDAVLAAVECGADDVLEDIIAVLLDREGRRDLDEATVAWLARAASLGNVAATKTLTYNVFQAPSLVTETMRERLTSAGCLSDDTAVLDELFLLGIHPLDTADESSRLGMLEPVARYGSHRLVKPILDRCREVTAETRILFCQRALATATKYGRPDVVGEILEWASEAELNVATAPLVQELLQSHSPRCVEMVASGLDRPGELLLTPEGSDEFAALVQDMARLEPSRGRMYAAVSQQLLGEPLIIGDGAFSQLLAEGTKSEDFAVAVVDLGIRSGINFRGYPEIASRALTWYSPSENMLRASLKRGVIEPGMRWDGESRMLLARAAYHGRLELAAALLEAGADVNDGGEDWTPLHCAFDNEAIAKLLVGHGADVNKADKAGDTALSYSARWNFESVVVAILAGKPNRKTLENGLASAFASGREQTARLLAAHDEDLNITDNESASWLRSACYRDKEGLAALLLSRCRGLDVNASTGSDRSASALLHDITDVAVARVLLTHGADIELLDGQMRSPLASAADSDNLAMARHLVRWGARVNITEAAGRLVSPLACACSQASLQLVEFLVEAGANINVVDGSSSGTSLHAALLRGDDDGPPDKDKIVEFLLARDHLNVRTHSPIWGPALNAAALACEPATVAALFARGAAANDVDHTGRRPVHMALLRRSLDMVQLLLEKPGVSLDAEDEMKRHALHFAVQSGVVGVVEYVLGERPELVNRGDMHDWTPLLWALRMGTPWSSKGDERQVKTIVQLLVDRGASIFVQGKGDDEVWTPVRLATYYRWDDDVVAAVTPGGDNWSLLPEGTDKEFWTTPCGRCGIASTLGAYCDLCLDVSSTGVPRPCVVLLWCSHYLQHLVQRRASLESARVESQRPLLLPVPFDRPWDKEAKLTSGASSLHSAVSASDTFAPGQVAFPAISASAGNVPWQRT